MITFIKLDPDNPGASPIRQIDREDMLKCPHCIMLEEHYRDDGTCRCDDPTHIEMGNWGYTWDGLKWIIRKEEDR